MAHDHYVGVMKGVILSIAPAGNILRRVTTPPHDCCGHFGEPGC